MPVLQLLFRFSPRMCGILVHYISIQQTSPSDPLSIWRGSGTVLRCQAFVLLHQLQNIAEQSYFGDLLEQKMNKVLQPGLPLLGRGNKGEAAKLVVVAIVGKFVA